MKLREWLDVEIDKAATRHTADNSTANVVDINQAALSSLYYAVQILDERIERLEAAAGYTFDLDRRPRG